MSQQINAEMLALLKEILVALEEDWASMGFKKESYFIVRAREVIAKAGGK